MRRILVLAAAGLVLATTMGVSVSSSGGGGRAMSRADVARQILDRPGIQLTAAARLALEQAAGRQSRLPGENGQLGVSKIPVASGGQRAPTGGSAFTNVRVNDPSADTHQVDQTTQSETSVAVVGSNVAVGYNDSQHTPLSFEAASGLSGYSYSSNGGASFKDGGVLPNAPEFVNLGDPWLTSDRGGSMYYATLALDAFNLNGDVSVGKSTDGGKTWADPVPVFRPPFEIVYSGDKEAITSGPDPLQPARDDLYVAYDDFSFDMVNCCFLKTGLPVAHSVDGGATWELSYADRFTNTFENCSFHQYIGAQPIVDPANGRLYVAAERIDTNNPDCVFPSPPPKFSEWIFRSDDGGQSFGPGVKIAKVTPSVPQTSFGLGVLKLAPGQYMRNLEFPTLAWLGHDLFAAWNDGAQGKSHIRLAKSADGGKTWTVHFVTSGSGDQVQPAMSGDAPGLHLIYYNRNADNTLDVYASNSTNGVVFHPKRVTSESSPGVFTAPPFDPIIAFFYMGDYIANVSNGTHRYFAWGDNRDTVSNFFWPNGRHDPDVFFAKH